MGRTSSNLKADAYMILLMSLNRLASLKNKRMERIKTFFYGLGLRVSQSTPKFNQTKSLMMRKRRRRLRNWIRKTIINEQIRQQDLILQPD